MIMQKTQKFQCKGKKIVDQFGREIIFKGASLICKEKSMNYYDNWTDDDFDVLKRMGTSLIRLGIVWDGVEPQPSVYDEKYLKQLDNLIETVGKHNIYVYLDMHQDLYGIPVGGGAPEWATLMDGCENQVMSELWSDAYITSDAVHTAFDNFWTDKPTSDGIGVQTHYVNMWDMLMDRYKNNEVVIGYDVMNEPFVGSVAKEVFGRILMTYGQSQFPELSFEELGAMWLNPEIKEEILGALGDIELYKRLLCSFEGLCQEFDRKYYNPFMKRISQVLRKHSQSQFLFIEANYFCNMGAASGIEDIDGVNLIFSPHGYDLVTDTPYIAQANNERVSLIFNKHKITQDRLNIPIIVGEWGAYDRYENVEPAAEHVLNIYQNNGWSDSFWCFVRGMENWPCYKVLSRSYPYSLNGELISYNFDYRDGSFSLEYKKTIDCDVILFSTDLKKALNALKDKYSCTLQEISENRGYIAFNGGGIGDIININW